MDVEEIDEKVLLQGGEPGGLALQRRHEGEAGGQARREGRLVVRLRGPGGPLRLGVVVGGELLDGRLKITARPGASEGR
jgi:hypothetical protein